VRALNILQAGEAYMNQSVNQENWFPACGGTEVPFHTRTGYRLLYVWQPSTGKHAYLNCETESILTDEEAFQVLFKLEVTHS
jgi:hypothetical protein